VLGEAEPGEHGTADDATVPADVFEPDVVAGG